MSAIRFLLPACIACCLLACSGGGDSATPVAASQQTQSAEAESTINGTTVHVTAVQSSQLPDSVARQYGIERSPKTILLLINLRNAGNAAPTIIATVSDLQNHTTPVALREVQVAQSEPPTIDYIGTVDVTLPDTLRFTVVAKRGGSTATVQLGRDFYPQ